MISWFDMPSQGLSGGGEFEIKELTATENKVYETPGEVYNKVTVNVEGGGGGGDFSTAEVTIRNTTFPGYQEADIVVVFLPVIYDGKYESTEIATFPTTVLVPLYKGSVAIGIDHFISDFAWDNDTGSPDISGDIEYDEDAGFFIITGNCSIGVGLS